MVRNIVLLGGNSHPRLVEEIANILGIPQARRILNKFSAGESRLEIQDSVRGKDVYIIQSGAGHVNDNLIELCIMISACKTGSAKRVTVVVPLFPYSRQPDWPYNKAGAPLSQSNGNTNKRDYTFESVPATPKPGASRSSGLLNDVNGLADKLTKTLAAERQVTSTNGTNSEYFPPKRSDTISSVGSTTSRNGGTSAGDSSLQRSFTTHDYEKPANTGHFQAKPGYKQWVALAGTLVADLIQVAGGDHVITMDLHDPQYQGFFDIPVDNLYSKAILQQYIVKNIPDYKDAIVVSPDAGGAKRATAIGDALNIDFALIHKERRPIKFNENKNASMMLVGDVAGRVCILVDDLIDTGNTITRAAKLLKREGAVKVVALCTHGVFSGDALARVRASCLDQIVVTDSVPQHESLRQCPKLSVLSVAAVFAESIRRVHHGESISVLFQYS